MSALAYYEPHKLSAGALALVVHALFFTLLFFGFNWHVKPPLSMQVEMWDKLPEPAPEIAPVPPPLPAIPAPVAAPKVTEPAVQAEIEFKAKPARSKKEEAKKKPVAEPSSKKDEKARQLEQQRAQAAQLELAKQQERDKQRAAEERAAQEDERIQEHKAKMRAEMDAATQGEVARYKDMISAKISHNIVMPPDVPENAEAKFMVIVLPGGTVVDVKLLKSSGNAAYDSAAEHAIYKAQPLPLPQDAALARMFRELRLSVKPSNP